MPDRPIVKPDGEGDPEMIRCAHCHRIAEDADGDCCEYFHGMFADLLLDINGISSALQEYVPESLLLDELLLRKYIISRCEEIGVLHGGGE